MTCGEMMTPNPTCCRSEDTIEQAAELMTKEGIGLVPVVSDKTAKLIGVLSDRDIVVKVVARGREPRATTVGEVMTPNPLALTAKDQTEAAVELMGSNQVRRMPIVDDGGLIVGIIAQADVATRLGDRAQTAQVVEAISAGGGRTIPLPPGA